MERKRRRRKNYTFEEKKLALETFFSEGYDGSGMPLSQFSAVCGIAYPTLCGWVRSIGWERSRIGELQRAPRRQARIESEGLSASVQEAILSLKSAQPSWGPLKLRQYLFRHEQMLIPQTSIYRFLKSQGLVNERSEPGALPGHGRSFEYPYPLAAVQMDLLSVRLSGGVVLHLVSLLDDFSRFVLGARFVPVKTMDAVTEVFRETVCQHGVMEKLLTDHGGEFVSWQRFTRFEELLVDLDVEYIASGPDKKENQGKVERWHQTVRQALRERGPLDYSSEAQLWMRGLVDHYNYERPHQALGGLVPADRFWGIAEELSAELEQYRKGRRAGQCLYVACRVGDRKVVISGPRSEALSILVDGAAVGGAGGPVVLRPGGQFDRGSSAPDTACGKPGV